MRWQLVAALMAVIAAPASAQVSPYRRFTAPLIDSNESNRIVYAPVGWIFPGPRPARQPYAVSAASWYLQPLGSWNTRPDKVLDKGGYLLEQFDMVRDAEGTKLRVVISRRPAPLAGDLPQVHVINPRSLLTAQAYPRVERLPDGVRYTFMVTQPEFASVPAVRAAVSDRYEIQFRPAREVKLPGYLVRAPTFSGADREARLAQPPPTLPYAERVAGKRIEYRSGIVIGKK